MPRKYRDILHHLEILSGCRSSDTEIEFVRKEAMEAMYRKDDGDQEEEKPNKDDHGKI
jgi:hypothetical protein